MDVATCIATNSPLIMSTPLHQIHHGGQYT